MTTRRIDAIKLLAAADPAGELPCDPADQAEVWSIISPEINASSPGGGQARRVPRIARVPLAGLAGTLLVGGVAFGSGLIPLGSPAKIYEEFQLPSSESGSVIPASVGVVAVTAPDPQGGPAWGLRTFTTSRGAGCIQIGRVVDGQLGVLGTDGAFGNDGRLHPLSVASSDVQTCAALDANGHIFNNISKSDQLANALIGPEQVPTAEHPRAHELCAPAIATQAEKEGALNRICPQSEERDIYYGLLGPSAESITYLDEGRHVTAPTSGPDGAYLIVTDASPDWSPNAFAVGATGSLPVDGPITEIHYSDGTVCHTTPKGSDAGCTPNGVPIGFVPAEPTPTPAQAAAAVTATVTQSPTGQNEAIVRVKAPLAVSSVRDEYQIHWSRPDAEPTEAEGNVNMTSANVEAGQELSVRTGRLPSGTTTLQVVLDHASGPAIDEGEGTIDVPVGETTVTVP
jgi:hypothetical protein